ncbi:MAG: dihydropteridine reductase [Clostridiales bacterium]|nr:dihydropteridine reductase [Clostridiales bacterium]
MDTDKIYAEQLASEYAPKKDSKVKALKKLDAKAKNPANIFTFTFGVISALILGTGMSLAMGVIGGGTPLMMALGIVVGCIGIVGVSINYPIYKRILKKSKDKYATDIINLANEIVNED